MPEEVKTPRLTEDDVDAIKAVIESHAGEIPSGLHSGQVVLKHARALAAEAEMLQADLERALGALADIANMTQREIADGVAQRKAKRIYNLVRGYKPGDPDFAE